MAEKLVDRLTLSDVRGNMTMQRMNTATISNLEAENAKRSQIPSENSHLSKQTKELIGEYCGRISHINSATDFFLQFNDKIPALDKLKNDLSIVAPSLPPLKTFDVKMFCVAFCSMSQTWNRAKIIDSDGITISIEFLDSGITDTVTNKDYLKMMTEELKARPLMAFRCALPIKIHKSGEDDAMKMLEKVIFMMSEVFFRKLGVDYIFVLGQRQCVLQFYHQK